VSDMQGHEQKYGQEHRHRHKHGQKHKCRRKRGREREPGHGYGHSAGAGVRVGTGMSVSGWLTRYWQGSLKTSVSDKYGLESERGHGHVQGHKQLRRYER
jgi:hypothetical protein